MGKLVLPNQPGPPARISHLVPPFLLGSQAAQAFGRGSLNFLELLLQGIWHKRICPFTWLPFLLGSFHWFVAHLPHPLFLFIYKRPTCSKEARVWFQYNEKSKKSLVRVCCQFLTRLKPAPPPAPSENPAGSTSRPLCPRYCRDFCSLGQDFKFLPQKVLQCRRDSALKATYNNGAD